MIDIDDIQLAKIIDIEYVNELIYFINESQSSTRTPKYTSKYYLYHILLVLTDLQKWKSLNLLFDNRNKFHFKTIQDKHLEWSKLNIYEDAYRSLLNKYKGINFKKSANLVLFIDSTVIYNKNGVELIGYGQNPKKKETKVSAICDKNKNIHSIIVTNVNHKTTTKNTLIDDAHTVEANLDNLFQHKINAKKIKLVGDKGYARKSKDKDEIKDKYNTELLYPHRKNQKIKTPKETKILLKNRYVIENVFAKLKKFDRICMRKDRLVTTFKGFLFLASILIFKK